VRQRHVRAAPRRAIPSRPLDRARRGQGQLVREPRGISRAVDALLVARPELRRRPRHHRSAAQRAAPNAGALERRDRRRHRLPQRRRAGARGGAAPRSRPRGARLSGAVDPRQRRTDVPAADDVGTLSQPPLLTAYGMLAAATLTNVTVPHVPVMPPGQAIFVYPASTFVLRKNAPRSSSRCSADVVKSSRLCAPKKKRMPLLFVCTIVIFAETLSANALDAESARSKKVTT